MWKINLGGVGDKPASGKGVGRKQAGRGEGCPRYLVEHYIKLRDASFSAKIISTFIQARFYLPLPSQIHCIHLIFYQSLKGKRL